MEQPPDKIQFDGFFIQHNSFLLFTLFVTKAIKDNKVFLQPFNCTSAQLYGTAAATATPDTATAIPDAATATTTAAIL